MKHLKSIITLFILSFAVLSCSDDDDNTDTQPQEEELIGTWSMTGFESEDAEITLDLLGQEVNAAFVATGSNFDNSITFLEDNTGTSEGEFVTTATFNFAGQAYTESDSVPFTTEDSFDWSLSGNDLIITEADVASTFTVVTLTETSLVLDLDVATFQNLISDFEDLEDFGDVSASGNIIATFVKN